MRNLGSMAAMLALSSMGAVKRVADDFDEKIVEPRHDERMRQRAAAVERQRQYVEERRAPKVLTGKDAERVQLAAERRARKVARQAGGFVPAKDGTARQSVTDPGSTS